MAFKEKYVISITVFLAIGCVSGRKRCGNLETNGYTVPSGDIVLKYGEPLSITCSLYDDKYGENASSRLYFTRNNDPFPPEMIEILNSTSIRLHFPQHPKTVGDNYYCLFKNKTNNDTPLKMQPKEDMICMNYVIVGVPPQNVTDFSCISRNYENLTCTWTAPENFVRTHYNLTYYLKLRAARFQYSCPKIEEKEKGQMSCFWNVSTEPQYRQSHPTFYFRLGMNNTFGSIMNDYIFDHFKRVLPNAPENLTAIATSPHSINLTWVIPSVMVNFQPGLKHRILYQCEYYEKVWQFGGLIVDSDRSIKKITFVLDGLKYAHALCDIRVSMKSKQADENDESMWSENATTTVRTQSKIPDCPPRTNIGSFQVVNNFPNRVVYVYWQQLREEQKNGQNFSYYVEVENHSLLRPELTRAYAKFNNLAESDYVITIRSMNEVGYSLEKSTVIIPAKRLREPSDFVKVEHEENLYELSWDPPPEPERVITNYTIFWCSNDRDRPYQCTGYLNWTTVPKDVDKWNQTLPGRDIYQFAISANSHNSSSGMTWAECILLPNMGVSKIKTVIINRVGSDFIELGWKLDCSNRIVSAINGFIIYYCPVNDCASSCKDVSKNVTIEGDVNLQSAKIDGLKPYTTYRLSVGFIINHAAYNQTSDPQCNTTYEAAPSSPPQNVKVINVTNSTISIQWQPPKTINGMLKNYLIYYKNNTELYKTIDPHEHETTITDLMSFENYSITMQACTVHCSDFSSPINVETKMGLPDKIDKPEIIFPNASHITFTWTKPKYPRGKINYYQVNFTQKFILEDKTIPYDNVTAQNFTIQNCESGKYEAAYISVRAVNIIDGNHVAGPWSEVRDWPCHPQYIPFVYILVGISVILIAIATTCVFKRVYVSIKDMKNIGVVLPPGLDQKVGNESMNKIGADEEYLLDKIKEGIRSSADTSGCSSGHESITSLESTAHISPLDSGTEQPRSPSLSGDRRPSLRQRNVPTSRPTISKGYVLPDAVPITNWSTKPTPVPAGNYCVLGVDPSNQTDTNSSYVPITDVNTKLQLPFSCDLSQPPPSYVVTGDFIKSPNPGYVPYTAVEPADKNTGYVVAGLTKDLVTPDLLQCDTPKSKSIEEKPLYVKAAEVLPNLKGVQFPWQQPPLETTSPKLGYVSVGDAAPPKSISEVTKGYVPHRQFEAKSLKED